MRQSKRTRCFSTFPMGNMQFLCLFGVLLLQERMVVGEGFEPSKSETADLQSAPFGRSGTPPRNSWLRIVIRFSPESRG